MFGPFLLAELFVHAVNSDRADLCGSEAQNTRVSASGGPGTCLIDNIEIAGRVEVEGSVGGLGYQGS